MPERTPEFLPAVLDHRSGNARNIIHRLFDSNYGVPGHVVPRWIFLRALAAIESNISIHPKRITRILGQ